MNDIEVQILNGKILVVDDMQANVDLLELVLSVAGYQNVQSTTGSREVQVLYEKGDFDLILLDIRMPHLDGFQVMEPTGGTTA